MFFFITEFFSCLSSNSFRVCVCVLCVKLSALFRIHLFISFNIFFVSDSLIHLRFFTLFFSSSFAAEVLRSVYRRLTEKQKLHTMTMKNTSAHNYYLFVELIICNMVVIRCYFHVTFFSSYTLSVDLCRVSGDSMILVTMKDTLAEESKGINKTQLAKLKKKRDSFCSSEILPHLIRNWPEGKKLLSTWQHSHLMSLIIENRAQGFDNWFTLIYLLKFWLHRWQWKHLFFSPIWNRFQFCLANAVVEHSHTNVITSTNITTSPNRAQKNYKQRNRRC